MNTILSAQTPTGKIFQHGERIRHNVTGQEMLISNIGHPKAASGQYITLKNPETNNETNVHISQMDVFSHVGFTNFN